MVVKLPIPDQAHIRVKKGQKVKIGDPLYSFKQRIPKTINISGPLSIKPSDIYQYISTSVGSHIKEGDTLAMKKKVIGKKKIQSPVSGVVQKIDHESGSIIIDQEDGNDQTLTTFFKGEIHDIDESNCILSVDIGKAKELAAKGTFNCGGEMTITSSKDSYTLAQDKIRDRFIITDTLQSHIETKVEALGGCGVMYLKGSSDTDFPTVQLSNKDDYDMLIKSSYTHIIYSPIDNKAYIYT